MIDSTPYVGNIQTGFPADIDELYRRCSIRSRDRLEDHTLSPPPQRSCQCIHERTAENKEGRTKEMPPVEIHTCDFSTSEWMLFCPDSRVEPLRLQTTLWVITFRLQFWETFEAQFLFPLGPR